MEKLNTKTIKGDWLVLKTFILLRNKDLKRGFFLPDLKESPLRSLVVKN